jgi:hypothetical protein
MSDDKPALRELQYEPLPDSDVPLVRLVELLPGKDCEPIIAVLKVSKLNVEYEALSYCWGGGPVDSPITCNELQLHITHNLKCSLQDLRRPDSPRLLWIDAICINQDDITEREQQVGIMGDIYRNAQRTVVWLGEAFMGTQIAFQALKRMYDLHYAKISDCAADIMAMIVRGEHFTVQDPTTSPTDEELDALYTLLKRPWFLRMWVIQEISLAKRILVTCGNQELDWKLFFGGAVVVFYLGFHGTGLKSSLFAALFELEGTRSNLSKRPHDLELVELLNSFRRFRVTDPRDKVFALYGLLQTSDNKSQLICDYHSNPGRVFIKVAESILESCTTLDILSSPHGSTKFSKSLPSWVPDWSDSSDRIHSLFSHEETQGDRFFTVPFNAASSSPLPPPIFGPNNSLTLRGHRLDYIRTLGDALPYADFDIDDLQKSTKHAYRKLFKRVYVSLNATAQQRDKFVLWNNMVLGWQSRNATAEYAHTCETIEVAYMRTLSGDKLLDGVDFSLESFREWQERLWPSFLLRAAKVHKLPSLHQGLGALSILLPKRRKEIPFSAMVEISLLRRICWTEKDFLGLVPRETLVGDEIWLLKGGRVPVVLRPVIGTAGRELIGDCYMHGVMYGEAFGNDKCEQVLIV